MSADFIGPDTIHITEYIEMFDGEFLVGHKMGCSQLNFWHEKAGQVIEIITDYDVKYTLILNSCTSVSAMNQSAYETDHTGQVCKDIFVLSSDGFVSGFQSVQQLIRVGEPFFFAIKGHRVYTTAVTSIYKVWDSCG